MDSRLHAIIEAKGGQIYVHLSNIPLFTEVVKLILSFIVI